MKEVAIVGLGFVGLPLLLSISRKKNHFKKIIGVESNNQKGKKRIKEIYQYRKNRLFIDKKLNSILSKNLKKLSITTNFKETSKADFIFFCYPYNINKKLKTNFIDYYRLIKKYYLNSKKNSIFILNSTINPGFTSKILQKLNKEKILRKDIFFVYSPERVTPGLNYYNSIVNSHKVFSSNSNKRVSLKIKKLFSVIFNTKKYKITEFDKYEEAECIKILENSYRASNIALIEEWAIFAEKIGINLFSILNAIKLRSTHSNIMRPGLGVGGYCLTKDPYFIKLSSKQYLDNKMNFPFIDLTMKINSKMHSRVIKKINKKISIDKRIKNILVFGLSYTENVDDLRNSKSLDLVNELKNLKRNIDIYDPIIKISSYKKMKVIKKIKNLNKYHVLIFNVKHRQIEKMTFNTLKSNQIIIDTNNVLSLYQIKTLIKKGSKIDIVGRGDI